MSEFPGYYSAGDAGFKDGNGYLHIMARTDDIINVAGLYHNARAATRCHATTPPAPPRSRSVPPIADTPSRPHGTPAAHRLSTGSLEEACQEHPNVVECAVVGTQDDLKGEVPIALLVTTNSTDDEALVAEVVGLVRERVGAVASMRQAAIVPALPKTRSGKILRNVIRAIADDVPYKLPGTIENASVVDGVVEAVESLGYGSQRRDGGQ